MCHNIQIIERDYGPKAKRWMVGVFHADLHIDLRFPRRYFPTEQAALNLAIIYAMRCIPGGILEPWCGGWIARNGGKSITIMVVPA